MTAGVAGTRIRLLQLASPALPIGGYSYSTGLETAIDDGRVTDGESALAWIRDMLELVLGRFDAPAVAGAARAAARGDLADLARLNRVVLAARETAELRLESEQMGYSLRQWLRAVVEAPTATDLLPEGPLAAPIVWGVAGTRLGLTDDETVDALLWSFAENQVMVLLKAMPIGQLQGQRLLHALVPVIGSVGAAAVALEPDDWSSAAPGLAIASMRHEVQYSRLFRS